MVFPHAGAGPYALLPVVRLLPRCLDVLGVTLPGRDRRLAESTARTPSDPSAVTGAIAAELAALPPLPTVLLGHSLGSALAVSVALGGAVEVTATVLSAHPSPGTPAQLAGRWSEAELVRLIRAGGATPEAVVDSPVWRRHLFAVLRSDLTLSTRLVALTDRGALTVPTTVLTGVDDLVAPPLAWPRRTRVRQFPGGHFFLLRPEVAPVVAAEVAAAFDGAAGLPAVA